MSNKAYPSQTQDRYIVRFPDGMRDQIAEAAKANNRSMNAEILARLERSFGSFDDEPDKWRQVASLSRQVSDMHEAAANRFQVSALATTLLISELVPHLYAGKKPPEEVREIIDRAKSMMEELRAWDAEKAEEAFMASAETASVAPAKPLAPINQKGIREEPQAPARLDKWAKPKVRPEPPTYPKPKKGK